jgi:hypothetical protein
LIGAKPFAGTPAQCFKPAAWPTTGADLLQDDAAIRSEFELHRIAWLNTKAIPHWLGDGDLAFAGDRGGHWPLL